MNLVTVNSNKSTTIGGVEGLIRSLQTINKKAELVELYHSIGTKEAFYENGNVKYINFSVTDSSLSLVNKVRTKLNQRKIIGNLCSSDSDIIIIFHPNDLLYIPKKTLKCSKIIMVQTNKFDKYFEPFSKLVMFLVGQYIDYVTVYTIYDLEHLISIYPRLTRLIKVIPRGCRIDTAASVRNCSKKLVTIARIDEDQKNFSEMIRVFNLLPEGYSLDIYGGGSEFEINCLKSKVEKVDGVQFKGVISDVAPILREYSTFLMTSRYEGFGQTLIEARSQGLPIVAYETFVALKWIVEDGKNGFIIESDNTQMFADKIEDICKDNSRYLAMSDFALVKSNETNMNHIIKLWDEIL